MYGDEEFTLRWVESDETQPADRREGVTAADLDLAPEALAEAFRATPGAAELLAERPGLDSPFGWTEVAYFSACQKRGTASYLDLWDADHFDYVTDLRRNLLDCRIWFSATGNAGYGSGETTTGRVNCAFVAPVSGDYRCTASLQSDPLDEQSGVECFIDSSTFGPLPVLGTTHRPHMARLSAGRHHFRIRQRFGALYFLALKVERFVEADFDPTPGE